MSEPTEAAYEAAARAGAEVQGYDKKLDPEQLAEHLDYVAKYGLLLRAHVDAVWPLALAAARTQVAEEIRAGGESTCQRCGGPNVVWCAPSPLWNQVMRGGSINGDEQWRGIICPVCFAQLAEAAGIAERWRLTADRVHVPLETVTPSGRTWDEKTWMWRDKPECSCPDLDPVHGFDGTEPTYRKVGP